MDLYVYIDIIVVAIDFICRNIGYKRVVARNVFVCMSVLVCIIMCTRQHTIASLFSLYIFFLFRRNSGLFYLSVERWKWTRQRNERLNNNNKMCGCGSGSEAEKCCHTFYYYMNIGYVYMVRSPCMRERSGKREKCTQTHIHFTKMLYSIWAAFSLSLSHSRNSVCGAINNWTFAYRPCHLHPQRWSFCLAPRSYSVERDPLV